MEVVLRLNIVVRDFEYIKNDIESKNKKIIIFGAGMIGTVTTLEILYELGIENRVELYVDNDKNKWGTYVNVNGRDVLITEVDRLRNIDVKDYVIFLTTSRFSDAIIQLQGYDNLSNVDCYIIPMLCIENYKTHSNNIIVKKSETETIPKVIHYVWLGGKQIPKILQKCIDSWKRYCPDYDIICHNENNYDIDKIPYMKDAYIKGAYGFVPDYARLDILYSDGGIYLDTDVELVRSLDDLLYQDGFCCVEKWQTINFGGGSGAKKGLKIIKKLMDYREQILFIDEKGLMNKNTCGYYDTKFFINHGYKLSGEVQNIGGLNIYPYEVFHSYDYMSGRINKSSNTYGIHHFNGGWLDESQAEANKKTVELYNSIERV